MIIEVSQFCLTDIFDKWNATTIHGHKGITSTHSVLWETMLEMCKGRWFLGLFNCGNGCSFSSSSIFAKTESLRSRDCLFQHGWWNLQCEWRRSGIVVSILLPCCRLIKQLPLGWSEDFFHDLFCVFSVNSVTKPCIFCLCEKTPTLSNSRHVELVCITFWMHCLKRAPGYRQKCQKC